VRRAGRGRPVVGDRIQIQHVLLAVLMNGVDALAASPAPRWIAIGVAATATAVTVSITDTGPGLDSDLAERIFDPFFTTKGGGLGMGLTISRSIIEAHGGRIWAAPAAPTGTTVSFTLPAAEGRQRRAGLA
jgi:C4-dicarboxylate-specific signal transduction histidine kinase